MFSNDDDLQVHIGNIKHAEVSRVIWKVKNIKSSDEDLFMGEKLKATMDGGGLLKLNNLLSTVWNGMAMGNNYILPKKGNIVDCGDWTVITLLSMSGKNFALDGRIREVQGWFWER